MTHHPAHDRFVGGYRLIGLTLIFGSACATSRPPLPHASALLSAKEANSRSDLQPDILPVDRDPPGYTELLATTSPVSPEGFKARSSASFRNEIPLDSLPRMDPPHPAQPNKRSSFELKPKEGGYRLITQDELLAEVQIGSFRGYTWATLNSPIDMAHPRRWRGGPAPACGKVTDPRAPLAMRGISLHGWTEASALFWEYRGEYDATTCQGSASTEARVVSKALWPGVVYAFISSAEDGTMPTRLSVVSAATDWVSSAPTAPQEELDPTVGSFTYVAVNCPPRSAATVVLNISDRELSLFRTMIPHSAPLPPFKEPKDAEKSGPSVRVIIDVSPDTAEGSVVRTTIQKLKPSAIVDALLATKEGD